MFTFFFLSQPFFSNSETAVERQKGHDRLGSDEVPGHEPSEHERSSDDSAEESLTETEPPDPAHVGAHLDPGLVDDVSDVVDDDVGVLVEVFVVFILIILFFDFGCLLRFLFILVVVVVQL